MARGFIRPVTAVGTMLALLGALMAACAIALERPLALAGSGPGWFDTFQSKVLAGMVLVLLGLAGGTIIMLVDQRRLLRLEQEQHHDNLDQLNQYQLALEAELERQKAGAQALRVSEQRFRAMVQQLPVGIFLTDVQGEYLYVNDRWCRLAGLTAEQALGRWTARDITVTKPSPANTT